jgi:DNA-binding NarL/FixJ family response regulator
LLSVSSVAQQQTAGPGARQSSVSAALQSAVIPQQTPATPKAAEKLDPRALQILGWLDADPGLTGAEAARRLNVAVRTGQRLWRAAQDERERRVSTGQRRLHSVGEAAYAAPSTD